MVYVHYNNNIIIVHETYNMYVLFITEFLAICILLNEIFFIM